MLPQKVPVALIVCVSVAVASKREVETREPQEIERDGWDN